VIDMMVGNFDHQDCITAILTLGTPLCESTGGDGGGGNEMNLYFARHVNKLK
jgi:hypothetical protein